MWKKYIKNCAKSKKEKKFLNKRNQEVKKKLKKSEQKNLKKDFLCVKKY